MKKKASSTPGGPAVALPCPCSAFAALTKLQARFRHLYKTAGERREEAKARNDLAAMQENACERSAYLQAAMEVTNEIDLLNNQAHGTAGGGNQP